MTARRTREARPPARRYAVTPRGREMVFAAGRMGQVTTDQFRRLYFRDPSTASRQLAKLVALRLLDVHVCGQNEPNVYTLGSKGLELLEADDVDPRLIHRSRVGRNLDLHLRMLNDIRVELVLAKRAWPGTEVLAFHSDLDLRRAAGSPPPAYIPDAIAELTLPSGRLALIVEVDTGTEARSVFASKVEATVALWRTGARCWGAEPNSWRPVAVAPSAGRARALARAIAEHGGGPLWLVAEPARLREVGFFGPAFATADEVAAAPRGGPVAYRGALVGPRGGVPR